MASVKAVFQACANNRPDTMAGMAIQKRTMRSTTGPRCSAEKLNSVGDESKEFCCTLLCWAHINTS